MSENLEHPDSYYVKRYVAGDEASLATLINRHEQRIFNFIYSKVFDYDIANDIFQDTFVKVIRNLKLKNYSEEGKFLPWVMRIAHNLIIDFFRKNKRMPKFDNSGDFDIFSVIEDDQLNRESELIKEQIESSLVNLIKELPQDQIEVLEMRIYKEMSFKEIAEITGVSINTALGRMRYALINLRKLVEEKNIILTRM